MNDKLLFGLIVLFLCAGGTLYFAVNSSTMGAGGVHVPSVQTESQVMGMGVKAGLRFDSYGSGTMLDMSPHLHFWAPGFDENLVGLPPEQGGTVKTPHRYPAIPGGNISTVMHKGWSALEEPTCNAWFRNPPEAAVI
jgi:hypothetical protein